VQCHVSRDKRGLLGCVGVEEFDGRIGLLRGLAVAERARRAGLAALLVSALVADVRLRGIECLFVKADGASDYFSRLGFSPGDGAAIPPELLASPEFSDTSNSIETVMKLNSSAWSKSPVQTPT